jgi:starch synthase
MMSQDRNARKFRRSNGLCVKIWPARLQPCIVSRLRCRKETCLRSEEKYESPFEPTNPEKFARDLAARINQLMKDRHLREALGHAGRKRAEEKFSWSAIAKEMVALYKRLL